MISFSERRVLGLPDPGPTQSTRDRQPSHNPHHGQMDGPRTTCLPRLSTRCNRTEIHCSIPVRARHAVPLHATHTFSNTSIRGEACKRFANSWPLPLALELEARVGHFTILRNDSHERWPRAQTSCLLLRGHDGEADRMSALPACGESFQETTSTQWQKN